MKTKKIAVDRESLQAISRSLDEIQTAMGWLTIARERRVRLTLMVAGVQKRISFLLRGAK